jgi:hypothetical protein
MAGRASRRLAILAFALAPLIIAVAAVYAQTGPPPPATVPPPPVTDPLPAEPAPAYEPVRWRRSRAVGKPWAGRLVNGVRLPSEGEDFFTWDPALRRSPNRAWRRYGTDRLIRVLLRVLREHRAAFPGSPRVGVGDLSRPHGGPFGRRFGGLGHLSHQNGLDVDVYYPRLDGEERDARHVERIDLELAQDLVARFLAAGARKVYIGPNTLLSGPAGWVEKLAYHDDHLHVRIAPR